MHEGEFMGVPPTNGEDYNSFRSLPSAPRRRMAICSEPVEPAGSDGPASPSTATPKPRAVQEQLEGALKTNILFAHLEEEERREVFDAMIEIEHKKNDIIIRQGMCESLLLARVATS
jgi:hypothetical protein